MARRELQGESMQGEADASDAWVLVHRGLVPDRWRERAMDVSLIPLFSGEAADLLGGKRGEPQVPPGEVELLKLLARGQTIVSAARLLGVNPRTVERRIARLRERFGVASTMELSTLLARKGF